MPEALEGPPAPRCELWPAAPTPLWPWRVYAILLLVLMLLAGCAPIPYQLRLVKVGLVASLSGPAHAQGRQWVDTARTAVRDWNTTALAGRPYRVELVIYDEAEGAPVPRRLAVDPEVVGAVVSSESAAPEGMAVIVVAGPSVEAAIGQMLAAVTPALDRAPSERREVVRAILRP